MQLITRHGGLVRSALTSACTHVICGRLSGAKVQRAFHMPSVHIVPPCWVTNSTKNLSREDESLHRPQRAMDVRAESPDMTVLKGYSSNVFEGEAFFVVDCPAAVEIKDKILQFGGALAKSKDKCTFIIADTIDLRDDEWAATTTSAWNGGGKSTFLLRSSHFVREGAKFRACAWSAEALLLLRLVFTPFPRQQMGNARGNGSESDERKIICVSGYVGLWRTYLKELIKRTGAEQANSLTRKCTHLISFASNTQKHVKALEWGVKVVNHLWLHDSITTWQWEPEAAYLQECGKDVLDNGDS